MLTPDLTEGLILGARLLVAGELQLAADEVRRTRGRFSSLYRTVTSSCAICAENPVPTWSIRAERVIQDELKRRIYFRDARSRLFGCRSPTCPTQHPRPDSGAGERPFGAGVPALGHLRLWPEAALLPRARPTADATVTPFFTTDGARIIEGEYRRRFATGGFDLGGALALDDGMGGDFGRGFLTALGAFALRRGFVAEFDINLASDDDFLTQFDYSDDDRLTSIARILRTPRHDYFELGAIGFQSLREDEEARCRSCCQSSPTAA